MSFEIQTSPPRPEFKALAEKELRENEENVKNGIEALKKLLQGKTIVFRMSSLLIPKRITEANLIFVKKKKEGTDFTSLNFLFIEVEK